MIQKATTVRVSTAVSGNDAPGLRSREIPQPSLVDREIGEASREPLQEGRTVAQWFRSRCVGRISPATSDRKLEMTRF